MEFFLYIPALFEIRSLLLILIVGEYDDNVGPLGLILREPGNQDAEGSDKKGEDFH